MTTTTEAARILGVSPRRVRAMIAAGVLPAELRGRDWYISPEAVEAANRRPNRGKPGRIKRTNSPDPGQKGTQ